MKLLEVNADSGHLNTVASIAEQHEVADFRLFFKGDDGNQIKCIQIADYLAQIVRDALQKSLGNNSASDLYHHLGNGTLAAVGHHLCARQQLNMQILNVKRPCGQKIR